MMETIMKWIRGADETIRWTLESLADVPGSGGVFCRGEQVLSRRKDILGGTVTRRRLALKLALVDAWDGGGDNSVAWRLQDLFGNCLCAAPTLGSDQTLRLENARLTRADSGGLARAEIDMLFEYDTAEG